MSGSTITTTSGRGAGRITAWLVAWVCAGVGGVGVAGAADAPGAVKLGKPFVSTAGGYSIAVPEAWKHVTPKGGNGAEMFVNSAGVGGADMLTVVVSDAKGATPEKVADSVKKGRASTMKGFKLISDAEETLDGAPGRRIVYEAQAGGALMRFIYVVGVADGRTHVLGFVVPADRADAFMPTAEQILATFKRTGKAKAP